MSEYSSVGRSSTSMAFTRESYLAATISAHPLGQSVWLGILGWKRVQDQIRVLLHANKVSRFELEWVHEAHHWEENRLRKIISE
jgi:hypothetical protein